MEVEQVKKLAKEWLEANLDSHPGLVAAHFVGGITDLPDDAPFPPHKDVDMHLIYEEGSPALAPSDSFINILETPYKGLQIEGGYKSVSDYASPDAVLSNPEIAHHLTRDCIIYDPQGLLAGLQAQVRKDYNRRRWVFARAEYEKRGLEQVFRMMAGAEEQFGSGAILNLIGYGGTYVSALLGVATLGPPTTGSGMLKNILRVLAHFGRLDLYERMLAVLGVAGLGRERVEELLAEGTEAFDLAAQVKRSPMFFEHKLHAHMRPYFVGSCRAMMDEGFYEGAALWLQPYYSATVGVIMLDGPDEEKPKYAMRFARFVKDLGMDTEEARAGRVAQARALYGEIVALADELISTNPNIRD